MGDKNNNNIHHRPFGDFLSEIEHKKIKLWVDGESLKYKAPKGSVTDELLRELSDRKKEIIQYLNSRNARSVFYTPIEKIEEKEYYPLSTTQQRMYMLNQIDKESLAYNITQVLRIDGALDKQKLTEVIEQLIERHEALRTSFEEIEGKLFQKIHKSMEFNLDYQELEGSIEEMDILIKDFIRPYDLSMLPLFRFKLVKLNDNAYFLFHDMHHIISDGISEAILVSEFNNLYAGETLPELKIQYKDFAAWQENLLLNDEVKSQRSFWLEQLKGELPILNLPTNYTRPQVFSFKGDSINIQINSELTNNLYTLARKKRGTLYTILVAAYNVLLSKYTGQSDIIIGTPVAGRRHADTFNTIGAFVATLAIRNYPESEKKFDDFFKEVLDNTLLVFENQDYPFEQLVNDINIKRDLSRNPIFDTMFILQNMSIEEIGVAGLKITRYNHKQNLAQFDVTVIATENKEGLDIEINYCTGLFDRSTIEMFGVHYQNILELIVENPSIKLSEIDMLSQEEKKQILVDFNNTEAEYPKDKTIHQLFEEQVERTPDNVAVVFGEKQFTYRELNQKSNQLANFLRDKGVKPDTIVGIMVARSLEMVVAVLGILKAGGLTFQLTRNILRNV